MSPPSEFSAAIVELELLASAMYTGNGDASSNHQMMLQMMTRTQGSSLPICAKIPYCYVNSK